MAAAELPEDGRNERSVVSVKNPILIGLAVVLALVVLVVCVLGSTVMGTYNSLQGHKQTIKKNWGQVENVTQRQFDLIPNMEASVKGYMGQEKSVLKDLDDARTQYLNAKNSGDSQKEMVAIQNANSLFGDLQVKMLNLQEQYPELKSAELFQKLITELEGSQNRISVERRRYNDSIEPYNNLVVQFPSSIIAGWFGFKEMPYFEAQKEAEKAPKVDFGNATK